MMATWLRGSQGVNRKWGNLFCLSQPRLMFGITNLQFDGPRVNKSPITIFIQINAGSRAR
jgi:hypothetical protein